MIHYIANLDPSAWLSGLQSFNPETDSTMLDAELTWMFGGFLFAFVMCAFQTILRATKAAYKDVDGL